jgi:hypothetical protein
MHMHDDEDGVYSFVEDGVYSFVNRTTQLWNQLPEDALGTLSCKPSSFKRRVRKVINKAK